MSDFTTNSLEDAAYLHSKGLSPRLRQSNDSPIVFFVFDGVTEAEAGQLLAGPEAVVARAFYRALRSLRRRMTALVGGGPRR